MAPTRMIFSLALVFSLVLALTDARPRAKRQATDDTGCQDGRFDNDMGTVQIGDGTGYGDNEQCCFTFSPSTLVDQPMEVELQFEYFNVEYNEHCAYDYLTYENSNGEMERDCGPHTDYVRIFQTTGFFRVCFESDGSVTDRGVKFNYFIFPGIPEDFISQTQGLIQNFTVPTGPSNFTIPQNFTTGPSNFTIPQNFTVLPTGPSNFTIPQNFTTGPSNFTIPQNFTTGPSNFTIPQNFTIIPTGPSNFTIPQNFTTGSSNFTIPQNFTVIPTGPSNFTFPHNFTYPDHNVTYLTTIPSNFTYPDHNVTYLTTIPSNFTYPDHNVTIVPTMSPNNTCNSILTGLRGHFSSPGYNQSYPNRKDCNTTIVGPSSNYTLSVTFRAFDIEAANNCQYDYLQLVWSGNSTGKACGHEWRNTTLEFNITGGNVQAVFHSDGSVTKGGFHATYVITVPAPLTTIPPTTVMPNATGYTGCSYTTNSSSGEYTLRTGASGDYANNELCTVNLQGPSLPHDTVLDFTHFDVEAHDRCTYDSLDVVEGSRIVDKLCGSLDPFTKTYNNSRNLRLTFTSDYSVQKSGFSFQYSHHIKYCNATINGTSGSFATPPGGYQNNEVCFYTILTPTPATLDFTFSRFDVESASRCQYDSLTMGEDKLCGTSTQSRRYSSDGTFVMKLSTDGSVRKDGFHMSFTSTPVA